MVIRILTTTMFILLFCTGFVLADNTHETVNQIQETAQTDIEPTLVPGDEFADEIFDPDQDYEMPEINPLQTPTLPYCDIRIWLKVDIVYPRLKLHAPPGISAKLMARLRSTDSQTNRLIVTNNIALPASLITTSTATPQVTLDATTLRPSLVNSQPIQQVSLSSVRSYDLASLFDENSQAELSGSEIMLAPFLATNHSYNIAIPTTDQLVQAVSELKVSDAPVASYLNSLNLAEIKPVQVAESKRFNPAYLAVNPLLDRYLFDLEDRLNILDTSNIFQSKTLPVLTSLLTSNSYYSPTLDRALGASDWRSLTIPSTSGSTSNLMLRPEFLFVKRPDVTSINIADLPKTKTASIDLEQIFTATIAKLADSNQLSNPNLALLFKQNKKNNLPNYQIPDHVLSKSAQQINLAASPSYITPLVVPEYTDNIAQKQPLLQLESLVSISNKIPELLAHLEYNAAILQAKELNISSKKTSNEGKISSDFQKIIAELKQEERRSFTNLIIASTPRYQYKDLTIAGQEISAKKSDLPALNYKHKIVELILENDNIQVEAIETPYYLAAPVYRQLVYNLDTYAHNPVELQANLTTLQPPQSDFNLDLNKLLTGVTENWEAKSTDVTKLSLPTDYTIQPVNIPDTPAHILATATSIALIKNQLKIGIPYIEKQLLRRLTPQRLDAAESVMALELCSSFIQQVATDDISKWLELAASYWRKAYAEKPAAEFANWVEACLPKDYPKARKLFILLRLISEADNDYYLDNRKQLVALLDKEDSQPFQDEILLFLGAMDLRQEDPEATLYLQQLLDEHPQSPLVPRALMLIAWNHLMEGEDAQAKILLQQLVTDYPNNRLSNRARDLLRNLEYTAKPQPNEENQAAGEDLTF